MNSNSKAVGADARDFLAGAHGTLILHATGAVTALAAGDTGATGTARAAVAGDGFAAELVDAVIAADAASLTVSRGRLSAVRAAGNAEVRPPHSTMVDGGPQPARAEPAPTTPDPVAAGSRERPFAVDMTNWSVAVDGALVVKVVGTWGGADRAARQLTRIEASGASIIPPFVGRLDWLHPELGTSTIALVSELIDGAEDGWTWAVGDVLAFVEGGPEPEWPARIGELTAALHRALAPFADDAAGAAAPRPTGGSMRARAEAALEEAMRVTGDDAGVRLRNRAPAIRAAIAGIPDEPIGPVFDLHGDLHVGQLLRASVPATLPAQHRYWVIDFDGDPQLSDAEREQPDFAARDIAHMLSSVDLVGAVVMKRLGDANRAVLDWAERARGQLLDAYLAAFAAAALPAAGSRSSALLPAAVPPAAFDKRLIDGFLAEQLLRELIYADRYLPRWQYAPDAAITFRYPPAPGPAADTISEEQPWTPPAFTTT